MNPENSVVGKIYAKIEMLLDSKPSPPPPSKKGIAEADVLARALRAHAAHESDERRLGF